MDFDSVNVGHLCKGNTNVLQELSKISQSTNELIIHGRQKTSNSFKSYQYLFSVWNSSRKKSELGKNFFFYFPLNFSCINLSPFNDKSTSCCML